MKKLIVSEKNKREYKARIKKLAIINKEKKRKQFQTSEKARVKWNANCHPDDDIPAQEWHSESETN